MVKSFFLIFQFDFSGYFTEFELSSPISNYELRICSPILNARIILVNEIRRFLRFFQKFSEISNNKYFTKLEVPNPVVGYCQSTIKDCESCFQI